ncbi:MAG: hypothetical protein ACFFFH_07860 [Candidatus Thorarchaeota archaeon]
MPLKPREIEIETLKTPKGDVVTVKGLETTINTVYSEMASLDKYIEQINESQKQISQALNQINTQLSEYNKKIIGLGETFGELIAYLSRIESQQEQRQKLSKKQAITEKADLLALKEELSSILEQLKDLVTENES